MSAKEAALALSLFIGFLILATIVYLKFLLRRGRVDEEELSDGPTAMEELVEKYGPMLTLALTNATRLELVELLNKNPQGLTEEEIMSTQSSLALGIYGKLNLRNSLVALVAAGAIRYDGTRYYSLVDGETAKRMREEVEKEYEWVYGKRASYWLRLPTWE